nr:hypothetical protein CCACVL1_30839 [Ipomoea batatas]
MRQQRHSMEFRPIGSFQIIHSQIQVPQVWKIANLKRNHILEKVSETTKVPEMCQVPNLYWYCPREVVIAQVQKSELKEAADSRWYHSAQTIVVEIDAKLAELQMMPSQVHTFVRLLTDQEESSREDDRPLIFHWEDSTIHRKPTTSSVPHLIANWTQLTLLFLMFPKHFGICPFNMLSARESSIRDVRLQMTNKKVSETSEVPELCQLPNLYWYCPREVIIAQVQKSELKEVADSRWDHSAQTIVIEIDANQEESSKEDDRPLIFHCKRASASSLFACKDAAFNASKQRM